jgi:hypothetical protein
VDSDSVFIALIKHANIQPDDEREKAQHHHKQTFQYCKDVAGTVSWIDG